MGQRSPSHQWDRCGHSLFLLTQCGPKGPVSVLRCCTGAIDYTDRPERPGYGSRLRPRLPGRYFRDPGVLLRCGTAD